MERVARPDDRSDEGVGSVSPPVRLLLGRARVSSQVVLGSEQGTVEPRQVGGGQLGADAARAEDRPEPADEGGETVEVEQPAGASSVVPAGRVREGSETAVLTQHAPRRVVPGGRARGEQLARGRQAEHRPREGEQA